MDPITLITIALTAFTKFGPMAVDEFNKWRNGCDNPDAPTQAEWDTLGARIDKL